MFLIAETIGRFAVSIPLAIAITMVSLAAFSEIEGSPGASPADGDRARPALRRDDAARDAAVDPAGRLHARTAPFGPGIDDARQIRG